MKNPQLFKDLCLRFAQESHCLSKQVACLAIKNNRIIATGINGTPAGAQNCDDYFREYYVNNIYKDSKDSISFEEWLKSNEFKTIHHEWSNNHEIHAEQQMIAFAASEGISLENSEILVSLSPCIHCSKLLIALKPKAVYYINKYDKGFQESLDLFKIANILLEQI